MANTRLQGIPDYSDYSKYQITANTITANTRLQRIPKYSEYQITANTRLQRNPENIVLELLIYQTFILSQ